VDAARATAPSLACDLPISDRGDGEAPEAAMNIRAGEPREPAFAGGATGDPPLASLPDAPRAHVAGAALSRTTPAARDDLQALVPADPSMSAAGRAPARRDPARPARRLPIGAEVVEGAGVHMRVWAPRRTRVAVVLETGSRQVEAQLEREDSGYHSGVVRGAATGSVYRFRLDDDDTLYPDPASRFQPDGPHGPSRVVAAWGFRWTAASWPGAALGEQVVYEMHVGTFTRDGTWEAATRQIEVLADLGVTCLELMPLAEFPGRFGWGYDGVDLFAPSHLYGTPDDARRFVDRAHRHGLAVILDVVYNHFGPDGNYMGQFSPDYFSGRTDWGDAINFYGPNSGPVREFYLANARYWVEEFHLDGLRLDATQTIFDESEDHIVAGIAREVRAAGGCRSTIVVAENEPQDTRLVRPHDRGGGTPPAVSGHARRPTT